MEHAKNVGTVGHVDHGKTTLTAAMTFTAAQSQEQRLREEAEKHGLHPDRVHVFGDLVVLDREDIPDDQYNRAQRREYIKALTFSQRYGGEPRRTLVDDDFGFAPFASESMSPDRKGKSGKNKSSRRFPLPRKGPR